MLIDKTDHNHPNDHVDHIDHVDYVDHTDHVDSSSTKGVTPTAMTTERYGLLFPFSVPSEIYAREEVLKATRKYYGGDELSSDVWMGKYALRDEQERYVELHPGHTQERMAREFYRAESRYVNPVSLEQIRALFHKWKYVIPQGSPMSAVGNPFMVQSLSNCFVIQGAYDSYGGILHTDEEQAQIMKRRGGVGHDVSRIRPCGLHVSNAARTTAGLGVYLERFSNTTREVGQDGRRGALMLTVSCRHPEVMTFIDIKRDRTKVTGANMSVRWTDDFLQAVDADTEYTLRWPCDAPLEEAKVTKTVRAREIWDAFIDAAWECAEPGALYWDTILRESISDCYADVGFETLCTNPCFAPGTMVLTRQGHFPIESLVGKKVEIWDGLRWVECDNFRVTGKDQPMLRIEMHDGSYERVTPYHTCILENGTRVQAKDLKPGMKLKISEAPLSHGDVAADGAYLKGFLIGDGTYDQTRDKPVLWLYAPKASCAQRLISSTLEVPYNTDERRSDLYVHARFNEMDAMKRQTLHGLSARREELRNWVTTFKKTFPTEVFTWDLHSKCEFIAGVMDADGSAQDHPTSGFKYQVSSIEKEWLIGFQLLLKTIGVSSKLSLMKPAGKKDFGARGGILDVQDCWRLTIAQEGSITLAQQVNFARLTSFAQKQMKIRVPSRANTIVSIDASNVEAKVYCCTVPSTNSFTLTSRNHWGNCGEITLSAYDACRLMVMNLMGFVEKPFQKGARFVFELFAKYTRIAQRLMDDLIDLEIEAIDRIIAKITIDPEPGHVKRTEIELWQRIKAANSTGRRTGLGITALGDCLAALGIRYGSPESVVMTDTIYRALAVNVEQENVQLAKERGCFPVWSEQRERHNPYLRRVHDAISTELGQAELANFRRDYEEYGRRNISPTTTAPVGSISMQALVLDADEHPELDGVDIFGSTSGCEPVAISYETIRRRKLLDGADVDARVDFVDALGDRWQEYKVYHSGLKGWMKLTSSDDPTRSPYHDATSRDLDWETSVDMQAAAQKWISHSISKTCNLPENVSRDVVSRCYLRAWQKGCKGFTIYREGSRTGVIIDPKAGAKPKDPRESGEIQTTHAPKRPVELPCDVHFTRIKGEAWIVLVGRLNDKPYEVFAGEADKVIQIPRKHQRGMLIKRPKKGAESIYDLALGEGEDQLVVKDVVTTFADEENGAFTRALSLSMRHGVPTQYIVEQLLRDKNSDFQRFSAVLARVLKKYIQNGSAASSQKACTQCGASPLTYQEGCATCKACGWSKC